MFRIKSVSRFLQLLLTQFLPAGSGNALICCVNFLKRCITMWKCQHTLFSETFFYQALFFIEVERRRHPSSSPLTCGHQIFLATESHIGTRRQYKAASICHNSCLAPPPSCREMSPRGSPKPTVLFESPDTQPAATSHHPREGGRERKGGS